jgi:hypothetical protein
MQWSDLHDYATSLDASVKDDTRLAIFQVVVAETNQAVRQLLAQITETKSSIGVTVIRCVVEKQRERQQLCTRARILSLPAVSLRVLSV